MDMTGNTVLITGGNSGIGKALAERFHRLGNAVIITGRRKDALDAVLAGNPGMTGYVLDMDDPAKIAAFANEISQRHPRLNVLINNAGIMRPEMVKAYPADVAVAEATISTNLLGPIRLTGALLPLLLTQPKASVVLVSSGLAFLPLALTPTYCATKAAIHSYAQCLRYQLKDTGVEVLELAPPYVATELMGAAQASDPRAMPLTAFIDEVMEILRTRPGETEILVERVHPLRYAADQGRAKYEEFFKNFNDSMH